MITESTKFYLGIKSGDDVEKLKSLVVSYCIQLVNLFTSFQGTENPDKFKKAIDFMENTLNKTLDELASVDKDTYAAMLDSKDYKRVDQTYFDILSYPPYYYPMLDAMGEDWLKHEMNIYEINYDKIQKQAGKRPKWMI